MANIYISRYEGFYYCLVSSDLGVARGPTIEVKIKGAMIIIWAKRLCLALEYIVCYAAVFSSVTQSVA